MMAFCHSMSNETIEMKNTHDANYIRSWFSFINTSMKLQNAFKMCAMEEHEMIFVMIALLTIILCGIYNNLYIHICAIWIYSYSNYYLLFIVIICLFTLQSSMHFVLLISIQWSFLIVDNYFFIIYIYINFYSTNFYIVKLYYYGGWSFSLFPKFLFLYVPFEIKYKVESRIVA